MVKNFTHENFFLSNFYPCHVVYGGIMYRSSEAAYHAQKTTDENIRKEFSHLSASESKSKSREIEIRPDWEQIKDRVMYNICKAKFVQNEDLSERLLATGTQTLVENNKHGDTYWGKVNGIGENKLGNILMRIRKNLSKNKHKFNAFETRDCLISEIDAYFRLDPSEKAVINVSNDLNSILAIKLLTDTIGKDRVIGVVMQNKNTEINTKICEDFNIETYFMSSSSINSLMRTLKQNDIELSSKAKDNMISHITMTMLYAIANSKNGYVCNTVSESDLMGTFAGHPTRFNDIAGDLFLFNTLTTSELETLYILIFDEPFEKKGSNINNEHLSKN